MNKEKIVKIIVGLFLLIVLALSFSTKQIVYILLSFLLCVIYLVYFIKTMTIPEDMQYEVRINKILNTYDSILVRNKGDINLVGRNIIIVYDFIDLVNAQMELRKPICYIKQTDSCSFVLLDDKECFVYIDKLNDSVVSPVENEIKNANKLSKKKIDDKLLKDVENTAVIKLLDGTKSFKVSPVRENVSKEKDDKVDEEIEVL